MPTLGTMVSFDEYLATAYEPDCEFVDGALEERNAGEWDHSLIQAKIAAFFIGKAAWAGIRVLTELRIRVSPDRVQIPDLCLYLSDPKQRVPNVPPFLCIEICGRIRQRLSFRWLKFSSSRAIPEHGNPSLREQEQMIAEVIESGA